MSIPAKFPAEAMVLPKKIVMTISGFGASEGPEAEAIRFITEGNGQMYYIISSDRRGINCDMLHLL